MSTHRTGIAGFRAIICKPLALALLLALAAPPALALPESYSASYLAKTHNIAVGRADMKLRRQANGDYEYKLHLYPRGALGLLYRSQVYETSIGRIDADSVTPNRYDYVETGRNGREDHVLFEPATGQALLHYKGREESHTLPAEITVDPLSTHLLLMRDLAAGEREMRYILTEPRRIRAFHLVVTGTERVRTGEGRFEAIRVEVVGEQRLRDMEDIEDLDMDAPLPPPRRGAKTTFWLAPKLNYLPVRILHIEDDSAPLEFLLDELNSMRPGL